MIIYPVLHIILFSSHPHLIPHLIPELHTKLLYVLLKHTVFIIRRIAVIRGVAFWNIDYFIMKMGIPAYNIVLAVYSICRLFL